MPNDANNDDELNEAIKEVKERHQGNKRREPFHLDWFQDVKHETVTNDFVEGLLSTTALTVIFGASGSGKTFWGLDLALHVASGMPWCGREVEQGMVIWIAAENPMSMRQRIVSWRRYHGLDDADIPFAVMPCGINLRSSDADIKELLTLLKSEAAQREYPLKLIVIDTLSRAFSGGDENSSQDMGAFIANLDGLRDETGANICVVHHSGKDESRGTRGSSLLHCAIDTEIEIKRDGDISVATIAKQRDFEVGGRYAFKLEALDLGLNHRGRPIISCVAVATEGMPGQTKDSKPKGQAGIALTLLRKAIAEEGMALPVNSHTPLGTKGVSLAQWRAYWMSGGIGEGDADTIRRGWNRARTKLQDDGIVSVWDDWVWINNDV